MNTYFNPIDTRLLSAPLWTGVDMDGLLAGGIKSRGGFAVFDDFAGFGGVLSTNDGQYFSGKNRWISYQTASTLLTNVAFTPTPASVAPTSVGAIVAGPVAGVVDNDEIELQWGGHELTPYGSFPFAVIPNVSNDLVFETRFQVSSVAADIGNWYIGLAGAAGVAPAATTIPITASDAFHTTLSLLGVGKLAADDTDIDLFYGRAGAGPTAKDTTGVNVVNTYIKAGFRYHADTETLSIWIDGVEIEAQELSAAITAAATWPTDYMAPLIVTMQKDGTTAMKLTVDWIACAQLPPLI